MELRDLLELLYTARNRFVSIQVTWDYWILTDIMQEVRERWVAQHPPGSVSVLKTKSEKEIQTRKAITVNRRVWWQKPSCWRYEEQTEGKNPIIKIHCKGQWWIFDSANKKLYTNVRSERSNSLIQTSKPSLAPTLEDFLKDVPIIDPSFLLFSHDFQIGEEAVHAGREAIWIKATSRKGRDVNWDAFFWASADGYEFLVDKERGILLRYAAKFRDQEFAVASVENLIFDEVINESVFSLE